LNEPMQREHAPDWTNTDWEDRFARFLTESVTEGAAHDLAHVRRVVANARRLAAAEGATLAVVLPAAWLHDCVIVPKDSPRRTEASRLAAAAAVTYLQAEGYPAMYLNAIAHAIAAHSFSARIPPETTEARIVQDADRLDALGAIGIARTLMLGGAMGTPLYNPGDPFAALRPPDDHAWTLDHFYTKLLTLSATMQTRAGRTEAETRTAFMQDYLRQLGDEIAHNG